MLVAAAVACARMLLGPLARPVGITVRPSDLFFRQKAHSPSRLGPTKTSAREPLHSHGNKNSKQPIAFEAPLGRRGLWVGTTPHSSRKGGRGTVTLRLTSPTAGHVARVDAGTEAAHTRARGVGEGPRLARGQRASGPRQAHGQDTAQRKHEQLESGPKGEGGEARGRASHLLARARARAHAREKGLSPCTRRAVIV